MNFDDPIKAHLDRMQTISELIKTHAGMSKRIADAARSSAIANLASPMQEIRRQLERQRPMSQLVAPSLGSAELVDLRGSLAEVSRSVQEMRSAMLSVTTPFRYFSAELARVTRETLGPMVSLVEQTRDFAAQVRSALSPFNEIRQRLTLLPQDQVSELQKLFSRVGEELRKQWSHEEREVFQALARMGLVGLESYLTAREFNHVLKLTRRKRSEGIQAYVFGKFRNNKYRRLNRLVRHWWRVAYMEKRKRTIRSAIAAHKERRFELTITTLLPLVDGLADLIVDSLPGLRKRVGKKVIYAKDVAELYHQEQGEVWSECVELVVTSLVYKTYDFKSARRPPSSVNRHGILHGRVIDYGSELNSYRIILLLDVMVRIAEQKCPKPKRVIAKTTGP